VFHDSVTSPVASASLTETRHRLKWFIQLYGLSGPKKGDEHSAAACTTYRSMVPLWAIIRVPVKLGNHYLSPRVVFTDRVTKGSWTTRGLPTRRLVNSWTRQLAYTGQLADWTTRGCHRRLSVLTFRSFGGICETASCPVRDLSSPRIGNPRVGVSASCPVTSQNDVRVHAP